MYDMIETKNETSRLPIDAEIITNIESESGSWFGRGSLEVPLDAFRRLQCSSRPLFCFTPKSWQAPMNIYTVPDRFGRWM